VTKTNHILLFNTPDFIKGAGVSQAAGIQPFRGTDGLFSQSPNVRSVLDLFEKNTFEVGQSSLPLLTH
jgi:NAD-dependent SIR2 family protein deacetylase